MNRLVRQQSRGSLRRSLADYQSDLARGVSTLDLNALEQAARLLLACQARGGTIFTAGNGGSASTASHLACDLMKGTRAGGKPTFRVVSLADNIAQITAWANDVSYERVFAEQFLAHARAGDLLIAISASGASPNVLAVAEAARGVGAATIAFTGRGGGRLAELADLAVRASSDQIEVVEDLHLVFAHSLCATTREQLQHPSDKDTLIAVAGTDAPETTAA